MTAKKEAAVLQEEGKSIKQKKSTGTVIYIGPGFKGVASGTVFKGGLTPALKEAIEMMPAVQELVIPVTELVKANKERADQDSALSRIYQMTENYMKGEKL